MFFRLNFKREKNWSAIQYNAIRSEHGFWFNYVFSNIDVLLEHKTHSEPLLIPNSEKKKIYISKTQIRMSTGFQNL